MTVQYFLIGALQNYFNDQNAIADIGGYLYFYKATDHATKKNIAKIRNPVLIEDFYDNPIELDASGSIPAPYLMYFADDEAYYIVLTNSNQNPENPPDIANIIRTWDDVKPNEKPVPPVEEVDYTNYMMNAQYRYHNKESYEQDDLTDIDKFIYIANNGWKFIRDNISSDVNISFVEFPAGQTEVPNNPIYSLKFESTSVGSGETTKDVVLKIADVRAFSGSTIQLAVYLMSPSSDICELVFIQHFGVSPDVKILNSVQITDSWAQYTFSIDVPSIVGKSIDPNDNYITIGIRAPLNQVSNFQCTNWQLNRGDVLLEFNYKTPSIEKATDITYMFPIPTDDDQFGIPAWDSINHAFYYETGTGNYVYTGGKDAPKGCLFCDGSTYKPLDIIPDTTVKYKRLYDVWEKDSELLNGNAYGYGVDGFFPFRKDSTILFDNVYEGSVTDWTDVDTGFVITTEREGNDYGVNVTPYSNNIVFFVSTPYNTLEIINNDVGNVSDINPGTSGFTVAVIRQGTTSLPEVSTLKTVAAGALAGLYCTFNTPTTAYYVWFTEDGVGTDPAIPLRTGIKIALFSTDTDAEVALKIRHGMNGNQSTSVVCNAASTLVGGESFLFYNSTVNFYAWVTVDGVGDDPSSSDVGVEIKLLSEDTDVEVATKFAKGISSIYFQVEDCRGKFERNTSYTSDYDPDKDNRLDRGDGTFGNKVGTTQFEEFKSHGHKLGQAGLSQGGLYGTYIIQEPFNLDTTNSGGNETRPTNYNKNTFVRF